LNLKITVAGKSDKGLIRTGNEDSYRVDLENNLFLVCDGMGGHQAGEVASKDACEIITYCFLESAEEMSHDPSLQIPAQFPPRGDLLIKSIRLANRSIYIRSRSRSEYTGMGTTVVSAVLEDDLINIAHVGDSRIYRMLDTGLIRLTTDHSWISELKQSGQFSDAEAEKMVGKNVITRALGVNERVEIDYRADHVKAGEIYILCTDGLCGYAEDSEIFSAAKSCNKDVEKIAETLVLLANDHGGQDNVTVIAIRIDELDGQSALAEVKPVTISVEDENTLLRENQILDSMTKQVERTQDVVLQATKKRKSSPLFLIFIVFVVIAIFAIYFVGYR